MDNDVNAISPSGNNQQRSSNNNNIINPPPLYHNPDFDPFNGDLLDNFDADVLDFALAQTDDFRLHPQDEALNARGGGDVEINDNDLQHFLDTFPSQSNSPQPQPYDFTSFLDRPSPNSQRAPAAPSAHQASASLRHNLTAPPSQSLVIDDSDDEEDNQAFADINFPPTPQDTQEGIRDINAPIDLTISSPPTSIMPPTSTSASKKRKRNSIDDTPSSSSNAAVKAPRETKSPTTKQKRDSVEVVDLEDIEEKEEYEAFKARQQAEAIKRQNEEEASKPVRLAAFQCIICMDQPTDLTVTHCGMSCP